MEAQITLVVSSVTLLDKDLRLELSHAISTSYPVFSKKTFYISFHCNHYRM